MKPTEHYVPVVMFIRRCKGNSKVGLTFLTVDQILKCDHSNQSYSTILWCFFMNVLSNFLCRNVKKPGRLRDPYFSLRTKWWLRGVVGGQFPRNLNWSKTNMLTAKKSKIMSHSEPKNLKVKLKLLHPSSSLFYRSLFWLPRPDVSGYF